MFASAAAVYELAQHTTGYLAELIFQYGAFGLVVFMVVQSYRQAQETGQVLTKKDLRIQALTTELIEARRELTGAVNRLAEALEDRPCVMGDQRFKERQT